MTAHQGFDAAFSPDFDTADEWVAIIGGNNLEAHIVKSSLAIRMGKDDPDPVGQADTSTASFEVLGDPLLWTQALTAPWTVNTTGGVVTDAPRAVTSRPDANTARVEPSGASWTPAELAGRTFTAVMDLAQPANLFPATVRGQRRQQILADFTFDVLQQPGVQTGVRRRARLVARYYTASPTAGGQLLAEHAGPWVGFGLAGSKTLTLPAAQVPLAARWVQLRCEATLDGTDATVYRVQIQAAPGLTYRLDTGVGDAFSPGEKVVITRNGATVWTGWVTDEDRDWSPSAGSTSRVNAGGPRQQYNQRYYIPRWGTSGSTYGVALAYMPLDPGPGGYSDRPMSDFVNDLAGYFTHGVQQAYTSEASSIRVGIVQFWKGADLELVTDLLDGAANACFAQVWELRDGQIGVWGHPYYRFEAPAAVYTADTISVDAAGIVTPVRVRREPVYFNRYTAQRGTRILGPPIPDEAREFDPVLFYVAPPANHADREYSPQPLLYPAYQHAQAKWDFINGVWNALVSIEHVDQWVVRRNLVDPQTWDQLVTARLGAPITINNIPVGLFRDFTGTSWTGFLWGWQLSGTDEIRLTVIDKRLFKL